MNRRRTQPHSLLGAVAAACATTLAGASIVTFQDDMIGWQAMAGAVTAVDFVGDGPSAFVLFNHFEGDGVFLSMHPNGDTIQKHIPYWMHYPGNPPNSDFHDGAGIAALNSLSFRWQTPIHSFAWRNFSNYGGGYITLRRDDQLVASYSFSNAPWGGTCGIYSTEAFDRVIITAGLVDDIFFETVPAPSVLLALSAMPLIARQRRRTDRLVTH